jgi:nucleotide-binding universal stress UspA family protein
MRIGWKRGQAMKSILLHVQNDESLDSRIETGLSIAHASDGHLSCLHVTPAEAFVAFDGFGGVFVMSDVMQALDEQERELRLRVERQLAGEDVTWDYQQASGSIANTLVSRAALNDVMIVGRRKSGSTGDGEPPGMLGDLVHRSRTPLLVPGLAGRNYNPAAPLLIGWDGSYEAANTVRGSVELIRLAAEVKVVRVEEGGSEELFPSTRLLEYLSRHDVHAELIVEPAEKELAASALISHAERIGAETLVVGGYSHSRLGEYLFGGVTRSLLASCPIALVIAQ